MIHVTTLLKPKQNHVTALGLTLFILSVLRSDLKTTYLYQKYTVNCVSLFISSFKRKKYKIRILIELLS